MDETELTGVTDETETPIRSATRLDTAVKLSVIISAAVIPLLIFYMGHRVDTTLKTKEIAAQAAIQFLENPDTSTAARALREWALDIIDEYGPKPLPPGARFYVTRGGLPPLPPGFISLRAEDIGEADAIELRDMYGSPVSLGTSRLASGTYRYEWLSLRSGIVVQPPACTWQGNLAPLTLLELTCRPKTGEVVVREY